MCRYDGLSYKYDALLLHIRMCLKNFLSTAKYRETVGLSYMINYRCRHSSHKEKYTTFVQDNLIIE